jgi:hypothetical protein
VVPASVRAHPLPAGAVEVPQLRTETSRTWALPDGTMRTRVFQRPVNYQDARGGWQPIDNQLVRSAGGGWQNKANRYRVSIPPHLGAGPIRVALGSQWMQFALHGSDVAASASGSQAKFADALPGVTASWTTFDQTLQEKLVLSDASAASSYTFDLQASDGLSLRRSDDGGAQLLDAAGKTVFGLAAPFAVDARGARSPEGAVRLQIARAAQGWTMTVSVDQAWLSDPQRAFPVTVDPDVNVDPSQDSWIESDNLDEVFWNRPYMEAGWATEGEPMHEHRALVKFDDPAASCPWAASF